MKGLKIFALVLFMIVAAQGKVFAAMPEVSANETYFDMFKGVYVLKGNVNVAMNNHGFKASITADEAFVSVLKQKCWANGKVKLLHGEITFSCDRAYLEWATYTAKVTGKVKFVNKKSVTINSDTAIFNWQDKIADFYGKVSINGKTYQHVQYNVVEDKILACDKTFTAPRIIIPSVDES